MESYCIGLLGFLRVWSSDIESYCIVFLGLLVAAYLEQ